MTDASAESNEGTSSPPPSSSSSSFEPNSEQPRRLSSGQIIQTIPDADNSSMPGNGNNISPLGGNCNGASESISAMGSGGIGSASSSNSIRNENQNNSIDSNNVTATANRCSINPRYRVVRNPDGTPRLVLNGGRYRIVRDSIGSSRIILENRAIGENNSNANANANNSNDNINIQRDATNNDDDNNSNNNAPIPRSNQGKYGASTMATTDSTNSTDTISTTNSWLNNNNNYNTGNSTESMTRSSNTTSNYYGSSSGATVATDNTISNSVRYGENNRNNSNNIRGSNRSANSTNTSSGVANITSNVPTNPHSNVNPNVNTNQSTTIRTMPRVHIQVRNPDGTVVTTIPPSQLHHHPSISTLSSPGQIAGMPRITVHSGSGVQHVNIGNDNGNVGNGVHMVHTNIPNGNVHVVQPQLLQQLQQSMGLSPLEAQPIPHQGHCDESIRFSSSGDVDGGNIANSGNGSTGGTNQERMMQMKKFECAICFEYMDTPVGCGSCQTRFCHPCLQRVLHQEQLSNNINSNRNNTADPPPPPNSAKCPHCRGYFTHQSITRDEQLQREIQECNNTVTCPFVGCNAEMRIGLLKSHEATCQYIKLKCKFSAWGCTWVGTKKDYLGRHEKEECEFRSGLGNMVERVRRLEGSCGQALQQQHMQLHATNRMLYLQTRWMTMIRARNAGNVVDVLQLAYESTCFPGRFSACKELWANMIAQGKNELVCNMLLLLPSLALILRISLQGFHILSRLQMDSLTGDDGYFYVDLLLLSMISGLLGILCVVCFFVDTKNSSEWTIYNVRDIIPGQPILRDLAACCVAMAHFTSIEFFGWHPGILLWHFTTIATVLFTSYVATMIDKNGNSCQITRARAWSVVAFGFRYGLLAWCCGVGPSILAVMGFRLSKAASKLTSLGDIPSWITSEESECFITQFSVGTLVFGLVAIASFYTSVAIDFSEVGKIFCNLLVAVSVLLYTNVLMHALQKLGMKMAEWSFRQRGTQSYTHRLDNGQLLPSERPCVIGMTIFAGCSFLICCVAMA